MPSVSEQMLIDGSRPNPELVGARFLLKPGRKYEDAVKSFQPYHETREVNEEARAAAIQLADEGRKTPRRKSFLFINNRLEGNALQTIKAILHALHDESLGLA